MVINVALPVDKNGGLRRCCPLCSREFKVVLSEDELRDLTEESLEAALTQEDDVEQKELSPEQRTCPYCGQRVSVDNWWTQDQVTFFMDITRNIAMREVHESFKRLERSMPSTFKAGKAELIEPRKPTEPDDMKMFALPCCDQRIKIEENWSDTVYCFLCGFPHRIDGY